MANKNKNNGMNKCKRVSVRGFRGGGVVQGVTAFLSQNEDFVLIWKEGTTYQLIYSKDTVSRTYRKNSERRTFRKNFKVLRRIPLN